MTRLTKPQYRLITIASILGILQGTAWFIMSLICIILYLGSQSSDPPTSPNPSYMDIFNYRIFMYFLYGNHPQTPNNIINPDSFQVFMWIYLIADILWVVLSIIQLRSINRVATNPVNVMKCWGVLTVVISFIDFLLVVLIGAEYDQYCLPDVTNPIIESECSITLLPVLVIAARGFVLWFVNIAFVCVTYKIIKTILGGKNLDRKLLYATTQIPRATLQSSSPERQQQQPHQPVRNSTNSNNFWSNGSRPPTYGENGKGPSHNPYAYPGHQQNHSKY